MTSFERVTARLAGKPVDRIPNLNIFMMMPAKQLGIPYGEYVSDYRKLADGVLYCYEKFETDCLCVVSDPMREAAGFGADVLIPEDNVPYSPEPLLKTVGDIPKLKVVEAASCRRMEDRVNAVRLLHERAAGEVPVVGWVEGALAEACDLMGVTQAMLNLMDEPEAMEELLDICKRQAISFALEQVRCGADFIGVGDAAASLISLEMYETFVLPYQIELFQAIHNAGARVKLHICGDLTKKLPAIARTGADIVDCDHMVPMEEAARVLPETCGISGNIDPVAILAGTRESIFREVEACLGISDRLFISAGCEIPRDTPPENVKYMLEAIRAFS